MKNFLVCDVPFTFEAGRPVCEGTLSTIAVEDLGGNAHLTWSQVAEYQDYILLLFAMAFGFLAIRKVL